MDRSKSFENIANAFYAVGKIQNLYNSSLKEDSRSSVIASKAEVLNSMLEIFAEYAPDAYRKPLQDTTNISKSYNQAYNNIKHHFQSIKGQKMDVHTVVKTLGVMRPVLPNQHKHLVDKIMKIYDVINS